MKAKIIFTTVMIALTTAIYAQGFEWAKAFGGSSADHSTAVTVDDSGYVYTVGYYSNSIDLDPGTGNFLATSLGSHDAFVQKLDSKGNLVWAKSFGGKSQDQAHAVNVDNAGNVYVTGFFKDSVDFDPGSGTHILVSPGPVGYKVSEVFVQKLDANGNFIWAKAFGYSNIYAQSSSIDPQGNIITVGWFQGTRDFDPGAGTFYLNAGNPGAMYVQKMDSNGDFLWAKAYGSLAGGIRFGALNTDLNGNILITGEFRDSLDIDPAPGVFNWIYGNGYDEVFVQKLDNNGNLIWGNSYGSSSLSGYAEEALSIVADNSGNVITAGKFEFTVDFDPSSTATFNITSAGSNDGYVQKLDSNGNFLWAAAIGSGASEYAEAVAVDGASNVYLTGYFSGSTDFDPDTSSMVLTPIGNSDTYILKLDTSGAFEWVRSFGGVTGNVAPNHMAMSAFGDVYATGGFSGVNGIDFNPGSGVFNLSTTGGTDIFIQKLSECGPLSSVDVISACDSITWIDGITYTASNDTATFTLRTANGCDSTVSLDLTINYTVSDTSSVTACDSYTWMTNNVTYTASGMYSDTLTTTGGCDSILTLDLTINHSTRDTTTVTACNSYTWQSTNMTYTSSGIYSDTLTAANGCDSIISINLTIYDSSASTIVQSGCDAYTWAQNAMTYTTSGLYTDTVMNAAGCDSIITLDLTINHSTRDTNTVNACNSYIWQSNNMTYTTSGIYTDTLTAANGCDSITSINLTIYNSSASTIVQSGCDAYTWAQNAMTYTTSGLYTDTVMNAAGCDSIITLDLTINHSTRDTTTVTACNRYTWLSNNMTYSSSGIYTDTLTSVTGCDSIISIDLTIHNSSASTIVQSGCDAYMWPQNGITYTNSGTYSDTITNVAGCDSVITLDLTIHHSVRDTIVVAACNEYMWARTGMTYTSSGIYSDTLTAANGCDSISSIDLVIDTVDTRVIQSGFDLIAQTTNPNATFQWIDCLADSAISGAISSTFTVTMNGNYSVEISENNCTDTSSCIQVTGVGLEDLEKINAFKVYPNPTSNYVNIELSKFINREPIRIFDSKGKVILTKKVDGTITSIRCEGLTSGMYFIQYGGYTKKMLKL